MQIAINIQLFINSLYELLQITVNRDLSQLSRPQFLAAIKILQKYYKNTIKLHKALYKALHKFYIKLYTNSTKALPKAYPLLQSKSIPNTGP